MNKKNLNEYRQQLQSVDSELLDLLAKRREVSALIAVYKHSSQVDIRDVEQEKKQMEILQDKARLLGLDENAVNKIFRVIIDDSIKYQEKVKN